MNLFKKKHGSGIQMKTIRKLEESCFDHFDMYYQMYTDIIMTGHYHNVDNIAISMMKVYDCSANIDKFYNRQTELSASHEERSYLEVSKDYLVCGTQLLHSILEMCVEGKKLYKKSESYDEETISKRILHFNQEREHFKDLESKRNQFLRKHNECVH